MTPLLTKELLMNTNINLNKKSERVEVMALFGYEMTPCQPLSFKKSKSQI